MKINTRPNTPSILTNLLCALVLLSGASVNSAQDERRFINPTDIPAEGSRAEDFTPRGWLIEERASGDLNRDGRPDMALGLIEDLPSETSDGGLNVRSRAMVVLLATENNRFRRAAVAPRLLRCTGCGGMLSRPADIGNQQNEAIQITNGVIVVSDLYGSREATEYTLRFRLDPRMNRFLLIGTDVGNRDRLTGASTSESTNYLTGVRISRAYRNNRRPSPPVRRRVRVERKFLEEFDFESFFDNY